MESKNKLERAREANLSEIKSLDSKIDKLTAEHGHAQSKLNTLQGDNPWVVNEKEMFNNPESAEYSNLSTTKFEQQATKLKYHKLVEENEKLKKMINIHVDSMAEAAESEYEALTKKRDRMLVDKTNIEETISDLDHQKNTALYNCFRAVNTSFSNIF